MTFVPFWRVVCSKSIVAPIETADTVSSTVAWMPRKRFARLKIVEPTVSGLSWKFRTGRQRPGWPRSGRWRS